MTLPPRRTPDAGITLVEMLVALAIFALVGLASFTTLDTILRVRDRTEGRLERLAALDRGLQVFSRDLAQADPTGLTLADNVVALRLTREATRRYRLSDGILIRETLAGPEAAPLQQPLFDGVEEVTFRILSLGQRWAAEWPAEGEPPLARAVALDLRLAGDSTLTRLVALPDAILP